MRNDRFKMLRERAKHTQESLAELIGRDIKQIWRWETGKASPSVEALIDIAKALGVSADYLLGLIDEPSMVVSAELDEVEHEVIGLFRSLDTRGQVVTLQLMGVMIRDMELDHNQEQALNDNTTGTKGA